MTNEQNKRISVALCGYEVQVSPAGKHYIVNGYETLPLPDFEVDAAETLSTVEALCKSRGWSMGVGRMPNIGYSAYIYTASGEGKTITAALAHCLLQIAEGEE